MFTVIYVESSFSESVSTSSTENQRIIQTSSTKEDTNNSTPLRKDLNVSDYIPSTELKSKKCKTDDMTVSNNSTGKVLEAGEVKESEHVSSDESNKMSTKEDYNSPMNLGKKQSTYTGNEDIHMCQEIQSHEHQSVFRDGDESDERKHINEKENLSLHAAECVEILDRIPFNDDKLDEEEYDYYDSLINI